jgi:pyruvate/2-oxoacid:ferredoxin oxidoreductase beta subunit
MIVLRNATDSVGNWVEEKRNLAADFRAAFGDVAPVVTGVAIAADTDQTGESVTAWFGDIGFGP